MENDTQRIQLKSADGTMRDAAIILTSPQENNEICSITLQPIGEPFLHVPLEGKPTLTCAQMEQCGHRFNAMALITHFASNTMNCPMCRAGLSDTRMDVAASFPGEKWVDSLISRVAGFNVCYGGGSRATPSMPMQLGDTSLFVVFVLFRQTDGGEEDEACMRLQCPLVWTADNDLFQISRTSARQVSNVINDMHVHSLSANVFATNFLLMGGIGNIASMQKTRLSNYMAMEGVHPHTLSISVHVNENDGIQLAAFTFHQSTATLGG